MARILIVDDEEGIRFTFKTFLKQQGHEVCTAEDCGRGIAALGSKPHPDLIFTDIILPDASGMDLLGEVNAREMDCPVVVITGQPDIATASDAVRLGAFDYLVKPIRREMLLRVTDLALRHLALLRERERYRNHLEAIFRSVADAILTVDLNFRIIDANPAARQIFGRPPREMIGRQIQNVLDPGVYPFEKILSSTLKKGEIVREYRMECGHSGRGNQVLILNSTPLISQGRFAAGALLVVRDITRLTDMESRLKERNSFHNIIGKSRPMQAVYDIARILADVETTVLITGESGTGKELLARAIHYGGSRSGRPMVAVNCAALSESLLESELFGHVKGAFTGAFADRCGCFQMAHGGTLFLDEIGDISHSIQLKLLRVIQEREFCRVGDTRPVKVDVRIIAATNRRLRAAVKAGHFREDLYYRIKVMEVVMPPLRDRLEDIPLLADHFRQQYNQSFQRRIRGIDEAVYRAFMGYSWPGNVRELKNAMEHAFVLCREDTIQTHDLPAEIMGCDASEKRGGSSRPEADQILERLRRTGWNKAKTARALGMSRKTLYKKLKKYNIGDAANGDVG